MAGKKSILIQLDSDPHASTFDAIVAVDAGVDQLLRYGGVRPEDVRELIYGAIFTRGPDDLHRTAVFIGGRDAALGEKLLAEAQACFTMGPLRVSIMMDANGANTTAAAAVLAAERHAVVSETTAVVLGATGAVGQRVVRLLAWQGARVRVGSRQEARAVAVCDHVAAVVPDASLVPVATGSDDELLAALRGADIVISAGAAGAVLLPAAALGACSPTLKVAIDLNAVPPAGIEGVRATDNGALRGGIVVYGAIGVGETKMKIHKAAIGELFEANDRVLDAEETFALGRKLQST